MMKKKGNYVVAVADAAGLIGREVVEVLEERSFPVSDLLLFGADDAEGERIEFAGRSLTVRTLTADSFRGVDIAILCGSLDTGKEFGPTARSCGAVVIDLSGAFSRDPAVPLVVPEVNSRLLAGHGGIIASPRASVIGLVMVLAPLQERTRARRVVMTTFEPVSGTGKRAMDELAGQTVALLNFRDIETKVYPHQIAFNCLPLVGEVRDSGDTEEEQAIADETRKVLGLDALRLSVTAVRVPVFRGETASVNVESEAAIAANEVRAILAGAAGVQVYDDARKDLYPLALDMVGKDHLSVGRIREDGSVPGGINLWFALDNLRKGSALNAVQIAEHLIQ